MTSNLATVSHDHDYPDIMSYDKYLVCFSGGKDGSACLLELLELGIDRQKIELWHHCIDGEAENNFMDWPVTESYCEAFARHFEIILFKSWRKGGFYSEMMRNGEPTGAIYYETPEGLQGSGGNGKPNTRLKFPQVCASLQQRWCSSYLKIDVCAAAIRNQERFNHSRTLVITGERAQESSARAKYKTFEPHRTDARHGKLKRHVDHWRPVHNWDQRDVWAIIENSGVNPHVGYHLGFGRLSCVSCIFASSNQWSSLQYMAPDHFNKIADHEELFGVTIQRKYSVKELAARGRVYQAVLENPELVKLAFSKHYDAPIILDKWVLPAGAYGESAGPS